MWLQLKYECIQLIFHLKLMWKILGYGLVIYEYFQINVIKKNNLLMVTVCQWSKKVSYRIKWDKVIVNIFWKMY